MTNMIILMVEKLVQKSVLVDVKKNRKEKKRNNDAFTTGTDTGTCTCTCTCTCTSGGDYTNRNESDATNEQQQQQHPSWTLRNNLLQFTGTVCFVTYIPRKENYI